MGKAVWPGHSRLAFAVLCALGGALLGLRTYGGASRLARGLAHVSWLVSREDVSSLELGVYREDLGAAEGMRVAAAYSRGVVPTRIAEPHRISVLSLSGVSRFAAGCEWAWRVDDTALASTGSVVRHSFLKTGAVSVSVSRDGDLSTAGTFEVLVKYVRRELRSLADDDRERFLSAMRVLWSVPTVEGARQYGALYKGIEYFAQQHLRGSAEPSCDHWHDGAGVGTHHAAFTLEFEKALQAVDPAVSVAYWDYTLDTLRHGAQFNNSEIFGDDWFGSVARADCDSRADCGTAGRAISRGRWAYLRLPDVGGQSELVQNARGLMRSPWNLNPSPYVSRFSSVIESRPFLTLPGCAEFSQCYASTSFGALMECMNGVTHGSVHINMGGVWGVDAAALEAVGWTTSREQFLLIAKHLWRTGYARCPASCGADGACACSAFVDTIPGASSAKAALVSSGAMRWLEPHLSRTFLDTAAEDDPSWQRLLDALASVGEVGEMFTSASPLDPTFWIIHPTIERLLNRKRLVSTNSSSLFRTDQPPFDETWSYGHNNRTASDTGVVCDWINVTAAGFPTCAPADCIGHAADDILPFADLADSKPTFTNAEFYTFQHPLNDDLPYIYDKLDWPHCDDAALR